MQSNLPPGVTQRQLDDMIDDHDCHASPEDGCKVCNEIDEWELADLANDELNGR